MNTALHSTTALENCYNYSNNRCCKLCVPKSYVIFTAPVTPKQIGMKTSSKRCPSFNCLNNNWKKWFSRERIKKKKLYQPPNLPQQNHLTSLIVALAAKSGGQVTSDRWPVTGDRWHVTHDRWHMKHKMWHYILIIFCISATKQP